MKRSEIVSALLRLASIFCNTRLAMLTAVLAHDDADAPLTEHDAMVLIEAVGVATKKVGVYAQDWDESLRGKSTAQARERTKVVAAEWGRNLARMLVVATDALSVPEASSKSPPRGRKAA